MSEVSLIRGTDFRAYQAPSFPQRTLNKVALVAQRIFEMIKTYLQSAFVNLKRTYVGVSQKQSTLNKTENQQPKSSTNYPEQTNIMEEMEMQLTSVNLFTSELSPSYRDF